MRFSFKSFLRITQLVFVCLIALAACTHQPTQTPQNPLVYHGIGFSHWTNDPEIEILDYRFGDGKDHPRKGMQAIIDRGLPLDSVSAYATMPLTDRVYVKWRNKKDSTVREETVTFRDELPSKVHMHEIYFLVKQTGLEVYLIWPEPRPQNAPILVRGLGASKVTRLHPKP
jgi:hypothetical protein